jgi:Flp pilus assembly protein TadD
MARWLTRSLCLAVLLSGCATAGQQASRAPSAHERLRLAAAAEANNNHEVALSIYRNAAQAEPDNAEVQARFARALADRGLHAEAVLVLEQAIARRPRDRTLLLALGRTQLRANDLRTAGQSFQRLLEQSPGDPDALNGLGVIADISGEHELAQERYREGLRRAPAHEGLRNNLALSLALTGSPGEAKEVLQRLRRDGNTDVRVRHNLAFVSAMAGDDATARRLSAAELDAVEQQQLVAAASLLAAAGRSAPPAPAPRPESFAPPAVTPQPVAPRAEPPPAPVAAPPPRAEPPATAVSGRVVLRARAESWVMLREQATGRVVFDRVLQPGESHAVPDRAGMLLTTGNAPGLEVLVDGEPLPALAGAGRVRRDIALDPAALRQAAAPPQPRPAAAAPAVAPSPPSIPQAATADAAPARVRLRARGETWVQVQERASGTVLFDRVMQPGESYAVPDRPGLVLTTGNAGGLEVQVEGETLPPLGAERAVRRNLPLDPATLRQATAPRAPMPEPAPPPVQTATPAATTGATARIALRARDEAWVQVRERESGTVLFDRILRAGEQYEVPARSGLLLTTGNAGGLEVSVGGEALPPLGADRTVRRDVPLEAAALRRAVVVGAR